MQIKWFQQQNVKFRGGSATGWMFLGAVLFCLLPVAQTAEKHIEDDSITLAIETELASDERVPAHLIDVTALSGVVTLSGSVNHLFAKDQAVEIAETVRGVRSVVNRIEVTPAVRSDQKIRVAVEEALVNDPAMDSYEIDVRVSNGVVTLNGIVNSWTEKRLARELAKTVVGVREIKNEISLNYETQRPASEIEEDIEARLANDVWVDAELIEVNVNGGRVALTGSVGSAAERRRALTNAWVAGVTEVDASELEVKWWLREEMRRKTELAIRTDEQIKEAITDAFLYDPRVYSFSPDVRVNSGEVTLTGTVSSLAAKRAAEQDAKNTVGVWRVLNHLKVRPSAEITDAKIATKIREAFSRDPIVERHELTVKVYNGKVYLYGAVDSKFEKTHAEELASRVRGVIVIDNRLSVDESWISKSDRAIKIDVESEITWNAYLDSDNIEVRVEDGVVTLIGTVASWNKYHLATEEAYEGGAKEVKNRLQVQQHTS